jgi:hypothetical protein
MLLLAVSGSVEASTVLWQHLRSFSYRSKRCLSGCGSGWEFKISHDEQALASWHHGILHGILHLGKDITFIAQVQEA